MNKILYIFIDNVFENQVQHQTFFTYNSNDEKQQFEWHLKMYGFKIIAILKEKTNAS